MNDPEQHLVFLDDLGSATRELFDPREIMEVTSRLLGRYLDVSRAAYADVRDDNDTFDIRHDYVNGCDSSVGIYSLEQFGPRTTGAMRGGETLIIRDVDAELVPGAGNEAFRGIDIQAIICCPLVRFGRLVAMMAVHQVEPRDWRDDEVTLVSRVVERSWATIERARTEQQLRRKERQFEELFERAPDAIFLVDSGGRIQLVNARAVDLFGYSRDELLDHEIELLVPEASRGQHAGLREAFGAENAHRPVVNLSPELRGRRKDGSEFPIEVSLVPMDTEYGPMIAATVHDNSERDRLQAQLQQALRLETVGQLAGGVAHDFNNLLTVINATAELLLERVAVDDAMRHDLGTILRAGEQATSMTRQLLALSRQQVMNPVIVDLNVVLNDMEPMLQRLVGKNVTLKIRAAADEVTVRIDRTQIDQVLLNLGLNSRDAMPDGGTLILETSNMLLDTASASRYGNMEPGPHVVVTVSDTGTGMDEATQHRIFEPFFTTKGPGKGTGLGLPTVRGIVEQSGGSLAVNSEPGKGTTIKIFLPRAVGDNAHPDASEQQAWLGDETVLVVEDEQEIRQVSRIMLERRGYSVLTAASGEEAISILQHGEHSPDLVLCDVVMPGMNGPETVRQLRTIHPEIKVLYMSGYAADLIARHGVGEQPHYFLAKPFTLAELSSNVRRALGGSRPAG